jgi:Fe-S-cluster containining protein
MLSSTKKPFYKESPLQFQCTACGQCCYGTPGQHYIKVSHSEMENIRNRLGLTPDWFRRRYIEPLGKGLYGIRLNPDGACPFLDSTGECAIYPVRPAQCRTYPFWPEVVNSRKTWNREARRCEGINRGDTVPTEVIEKNLRESEE